MNKTTKSLVFIGIIGLFISLYYGCKPRKDNLSTLSEEQQAAADEKKDFILDYVEAFSQKIGIHISTHPIYEDVLKVIDEVGTRIDQQGYYIKLKGLAFYARELRKKKVASIEINKRPVNYSTLLSQFSLSSPVTSACGHDEKQHQFTVCYDYSSCASSVEHIDDFAVAASHMQALQESNAPGANKNILGQLTAKLDALEKDIDCIQAGAKKDVLVFRVKSQRVKAKFFGSLQESEFGKRPSFAAPAGLLNEIMTIIKFAETNFLKVIDPTRINARFKYNLVFEETMRPMMQMNPVTNEIVPPAGYFSQPFQGMMKEILTEENYEHYFNSLDETKQQVLQVMLDDIADTVVATHIFNYAIWLYLQRPQTNDIRPWLNKIKQTALDWVEGFYLKYADRDKLELEVNVTLIPKYHLSPYLALQALAIFLEYEHTLPFRHDYVKTLKTLADNNVHYEGLSSPLERWRAQEVQAIAIGAEKAALNVDMRLFQLGQQIGFYQGDNAQGLVYRERDVALKFPMEFHSMMDLVVQYQNAYAQYSAYTQEFAERVQKNQKSGIELEPEAMEKEAVKLADEQLKFYKKAFMLACANHAGGFNAAAFFNTQIENEMPHCVPWIYGLKANLFGGTKHYDGQSFEQNQGLGGTQSLSEVCGFTPQDKGRLSFAHMLNRLTQLKTDRLKYEECNQSTIDFYTGTAITVGSLILMPVMGFGVNLVVGPIMSRVGQIAATNAIGRVMAQIMLRHKLAYLSSQIVGKTIYFGMESFLSGLGFVAAQRALMSLIPGINQPFVDVKKGVIKDWGPEVVLTTLTFGLLKPLHIFSNAASVRLLSAMPRLSVATQRVIAKWLPFTITTIYFTDPFGMNNAILKFIGEKVEPEDPLWFRLGNAALMTYSFEVFGMVAQKFAKQKFDPTDEILMRAKILRDYKIGKFEFKKEYMRRMFEVEGGEIILSDKYYEQVASIYQRTGQLPLSDPTFNPYNLLGVFDPMGTLDMQAGPQIRQTTFKWKLDSAIKKFRHMHKKFTASKNISETDRQVADNLLKLAEDAYKSLQDPGKRAQINEFLFFGRIHRPAAAADEPEDFLQNFKVPEPLVVGVN